MAARKRTDGERQRDRVLITELYCRGFSLGRIAEQLVATYYSGPKRITLSPQQIQHDLDIVRADWQQSATVNFDEIRGEQLAKLDAIEQEAWDAWRSSKGEKQESTTEKKTGENGYERAQLRRFHEAGDARFLDIIQKCIDQRCKILGLITAKIEGSVASNTLAELVAAVAAAAPASSADAA